MFGYLEDHSTMVTEFTLAMVLALACIRTLAEICFKKLYAGSFKLKLIWRLFTPVYFKILL